MTISLVTGATGFVGSHVARALVERGDEVRITVRGRSRTDGIEDLDVRRVSADVTDRRALRRAMKGVDRVFRVAGLTSLRLPREEVDRVNVGGTRAVLGEALRAGVERVVYTSSVAAIGPAPWGTTADETQQWGDDAALRIPAYVDGAINIVDVGDVARGHLLADELGAAGERYILGNRNYRWDRLFADLGRLSGIEPPAVRLPHAVALAAAEAAGGRLGISPAEIRGAGLWWAYRSGRARRELGWSTRPHEDTVEATVAWYRDREGSRLARQGTRQPFGLRLAGGLAARAGVVR